MLVPQLSELVPKRDTLELAVERCLLFFFIALKPRVG